MLKSSYYGMCTVLMCFSYTPVLENVVFMFLYQNKT